MTTGTILFYGGIGGIAVGVLGLVICMIVFPKSRKKLLKKLSGD